MFTKLQIIVASVAIATCSVTQAQSSGGARVIYNPQAYIVGGTHAPYANGIVGGEVYIAAHGENAAVMAAGIIDRARGDNIAALQIATMAGQARQPIVVCVPGSRCSASYTMVLQPAPQAPVFINRQTPVLPGPPAPIIMMAAPAPVFAPVVSTPHISTTYATTTTSSPTPVYAPAVVYPPVAPPAPVFAPTVVSPVAPATVIPPVVASPPAPVLAPAAPAAAAAPAVPGVPTLAPAITPVPTVAPCPPPSGPYCARCRSTRCCGHPAGFGL